MRRAPVSAASAGKDKEKAFYGVDQDAQAFADFIVAVPGEIRRWNSPKYLFGESYGTTRSAVLSNMLETRTRVDLNGVILLSQILNFDSARTRRSSIPASICPTSSRCRPTRRPPGITTSCPMRLRIGAAAARGRALRDDRLRAGARGRRRARPGAARRASPPSCTSTPACPSTYIEKADLRVNGGEFEKTLLDDSETDDRPARHALLRPDARSAEQGGGIRSAIGGDQLGLRFRVQRLRAQGTEVRREPECSSRRSMSEKAGISCISLPAPPSRCRRRPT